MGRPASVIASPTAAPMPGDVAPSPAFPALGRWAEQPQTISIPVKSDTLREGTDLHPGLFGASGAALGSAPDPGDHQDKLAPSTITLAHPTTTVNEGRWFAEIPLVRSGDLSKPGPCLGLCGRSHGALGAGLPALVPGQSVRLGAGEGGSKSRSGADHR